MHSMEEYLCQIYFNGSIRCFTLDPVDTTYYNIWFKDVFYILFYTWELVRLMCVYTNMQVYLCVCARVCVSAITAANNWNSCLYFLYSSWGFSTDSVIIRANLNMLQSERKLISYICYDIKHYIKLSINLPVLEFLSVCCHMKISYLHTVETGGSTCGCFHAGRSVLGAQSTHNLDSTERLLIGRQCSHCWWCHHWGKEMDPDNSEAEKL